MTTLAALKAMGEAATEGPWKSEPVDEVAMAIFHGKSGFLARTVAKNDENNTAFIVAARNHWAALIAIAEAAQAVSARAEIHGVYPEGFDLTFSKLDEALARLTGQGDGGVA